MELIKLAVAIWVVFTAVWMLVQDVQIERLKRRLEELEKE